MNKLLKTIGPAIPIVTAAMAIGALFWRVDAAEAKADKMEVRVDAAIKQQVDAEHEHALRLQRIEDKLDLLLRK